MNAGFVLGLGALILGVLGGLLCGLRTYRAKRDLDEIQVIWYGGLTAQALIVTIMGSVLTYLCH
jgi:hypothetical protein